MRINVVRLALCARTACYTHAHVRAGDGQPRIR